MVGEAGNWDKETWWRDWAEKLGKGGGLELGLVSGTKEKDWDMYLKGGG